MFLMEGKVINEAYLVRKIVEMLEVQKGRGLAPVAGISGSTMLNFWAPEML